VREIPTRWDMESIIVCYLGRERLSDGEIGGIFFGVLFFFFCEFCFEGKLITKTAPKHYLKI
jgi:hypothetical protein